MVACLTHKRSKVGIVQSEGIACVVRSVGFSRLPICHQLELVESSHLKCL